MRTIYNNSLDPSFNLALEEYLLKEYETEDDLFYLWRNKPSVVIGRNQNPFNEVNLSFCYKHHIPVYRRISGGGTVYHDLGNINFTYIKKDIQKVNDYEYFLTPIITLLNQMGLQARFYPKSHIYVEDKKISGNAQATYKNKVLHHGTILYDIDENRAKECLKRKQLTGHHVLSVPAQIATIKYKIPVQTTIQSFMDYVLDGVLMESSKNRVITLKEEDYKRIEEIKKSKYQTFQWNFRMNSTFIIDNTFLYLKVKEGVVVQSSIRYLEGINVQYDLMESALENHEKKQEILNSIF